MFWSDRCGTVLDPDGYAWMVGTHKAEPTAKEMKKGMEEMVKQQPTEAAAADREPFIRKALVVLWSLPVRESCSARRPPVDSVVAGQGPHAAAA